MTEPAPAPGFSARLYSPPWRVVAALCVIVSRASLPLILALVLLASDPPIEFNRPWTGCWDCNVQDICNTMTDGGSVDAIIRERYEIGTYGTQNTLMNTVTRQTVRSIADLIEFAARKAQV